MPEQNSESSSRSDLKRVLVLETDQVFGDLVLNLIANQERLVATSLRVHPQIDLSQEIASRTPDVVVVDDSIFPQISYRLFSLLQEYPTLKIVVLCTEENNVEVYTKQHSTISQTMDFFNIL